MDTIALIGTLDLLKRYARSESENAHKDLCDASVAFRMCDRYFTFGDESDNDQYT